MGATGSPRPTRGPTGQVVGDDLDGQPGGDDVVGVEAAVGSQREWSSGASVAHPSHRLAQEVSGARAEPTRLGPGTADTSARRRRPPG